MVPQCPLILLLYYLYVQGCTYKAVNIAAMLYHFARCGQEKKKYKCPECDKTYTSTQGVKYHLDTVHRAAVPKEEVTEEKSAHTGHFDIIPAELLDKRKAAKM